MVRLAARARTVCSGFSLVELAIVMTVLMILLAMTIPGYKYVVLKAREETLHEDLRIMRQMIDQYARDKEKAPATLDDLVAEHYLPEIPVDPMTESATTWEVILEDQDPLSIKAERGIVDVKSGSTETDSTGKRQYSEW
ncbi:MAG TPA: type II secretion system protein [Blastocatellia bacterium]|nr:type II secretion system protein [Blastocatellia bacterium]